MKNKFYWYCPDCKIDKQYVESVQIASKMAAEHDKEKHKGKPIAIFGKEFIHESS